MPDRPEKTVVAIRDFHYRVGEREILDGVSLDVRQGEFMALIGPNGAGKTTLLKCLMRIIGGGQGTIEIFGRPLAGYAQRELARRMSYVPQADGRLPPFTVEQFVEMGRYPHLRALGGFRPEDRAAVDQALDLTGTAALASRRISTLSGGERQTVYIAAALAQRAEILLLDEPTTFLDYRHQAEIRALLARVNRQEKVTIIAVTHDTNVAALESHHVVALRDGRVAFAGPPVDLMHTEVLAQIYSTPFQLVPHPEGGLPLIVPRVFQERRA